MLLNFLTHPAISFLRVAQCFLALAIFFYAGLSPFNPSDLPSLPPTFLHIFGNFCLVCSLWLALFHRVPMKYIFFAAVLISLCCELAQSLTQSRHTNAWDFFCNLLGVVIGGATCQFFHKWLKSGETPEKEAAE